MTRASATFGRSCSTGCPQPDGARGPRRAGRRLRGVPGARALAFIDPAAIRPMKVVLDGGNGMAGPMVGPILERLDGLELDPDLLGARRRVPRPRAEPAAAREPPLRDRQGAQRGRRPGDRLGRRRRPLLLHRRRRRASSTATSSPRCSPARCSSRIRAPRSCTTCARRARCRTPCGPPAARRSSTASATRSSRRRMRERGSAFGGEVSGHYYFADFYNADSGTMPALLILELLGEDRAALAELLEPYRSRYFISGEINSEVEDQRAKMDELRPLRRRRDRRARRHLDRLRRLALQRARRRTPSRCCACAWRASSRPRTWPRSATRCSG